MTQPEISLLDTTEDKEKWSLFNQRLQTSQRDIHFTPEYLDIYRLTYDQDSAAIFYRQGDLEILQPVIQNSVENLPFIGKQNALSKKIDIESPYGFGGPVLSRNASSKEIATFCDLKKTFLIDQGGVTEFCSFHPLFADKNYQNHIASQGSELTRRKPCAYIELHIPSIQIWQGIEERQRKAIATARKRGVLVKREVLSEPNLENFYQDYIATMKRVNANDDWHFPEDYFHHCATLLGDSSCSLFNAYVGEKTIASFFLIHNFATCYYHFSCSDPDYASFNANHLLMFDSMLWAKAMGYRYYFLGGGYSSQGHDSLYKFKQSFSKTHCWLYQSREILDVDIYNALENEKRVYERDKVNVEPVKNVHSNYFPAYRG